MKSFGCWESVLQKTAQKKNKYLCLLKKVCFFPLEQTKQFIMADSDYF